MASVGQPAPLGGPSTGGSVPPPPVKASKEMNIVQKTSKAFISGTISGWGQTIAGQPFDTVKVRLQANPGMYNGPMQCFLDCVKREGFFGLYKGTLAPMLGIGFCNALQFAGYEWSKGRIEQGMAKKRPLTLAEVRSQHVHNL